MECDVLDLRRAPALHLRRLSRRLDRSGQSPPAEERSAIRAGAPYAACPQGHGRLSRASRSYSRRTTKRPSSRRRCATARDWITRPNRSTSWSAATDARTRPPRSHVRRRRRTRRSSISRTRRQARGAQQAAAAGRGARSSSSATRTPSSSPMPFTPSCGTSTGREIGCVCGELRLRSRGQSEPANSSTGDSKRCSSSSRAG